MKVKWSEKIDILTRVFIKLKSLRLFVKTDVLSYGDYEVVFSRLANLENLVRLEILSTTWVDVQGIVKQVGHKLRALEIGIVYPPPTQGLGPKLTSKEFWNKMEFLNTIFELCPNLVHFTWRISQGWKSLPISVCLLYTSPSPRDRQKSRMPSSA